MLGKIVLSLTLIGGVASADDGAVPAPNKCRDAAVVLRQIHKKLYDVDTRPLAIEEYRNYRSALEQLVVQVDQLDDICKEEPNPSPQTLYKKTSFQTVVEVSVNNPCANVDYRAVLLEFEASSIRECFKDGYRECRTKLPPRIFNRKDEVKSYTWTCKVEADLLLDVAR